jgi:hypothetical protein
MVNTSKMSRKNSQHLCQKDHSYLTALY